MKRLVTICADFAVCVVCPDLVLGNARRGLIQFRRIQLLFFKLFWFCLMVGQIAWAQNPITRGVPVEIKDPSTQKVVHTYSISKALIISNHHYPKMKDVRDRNLVGAKSDLPILKGVLEAQSFEVETDENLDGEALERRIQKFLRENDQEGARLLVWFAGHGHTLKEVGANLGFIMGVDAEIPNPNIREEVQRFKAASVELANINTWATGNRIALHTLLIFDSCFSGSLLRGGQIDLPPHIRASMSEPVRQYITAGQENERVNDDSPLRAYFVRGLQDREADRNQDGYVTGTELFAYLREKVIAVTEGNQRLSPQTPLFGVVNDHNLNKGDFIFKVGEPACLAPQITNLLIAERPSLKKTGVFKAEANGSSLVYQWTLGDGQTGQGNIIQHRYTQAGTYSISVRVSNECGTDTQTKSMTIPALCMGFWCPPWKYILTGLGLAGAGFAGCKAGLCPTTVAKPPAPPSSN